MKRLILNGLSAKKGLSISTWHKDGVIYDSTGMKAAGHVYRNGKLKNTKGKQEHIVITVDKTLLP